MEKVEQVQDRSGERIRDALENGGRAEVTVRSRRTGEHVTVLLAVKRRRENGRGYLPRSSAEGRVGLADGDKVQFSDPFREYPNELGVYMISSGRFYRNDGADPARCWAAEAALNFALGRADLDAQADVFVSHRCSVCGKKLTDPISVERGIGPECFGRATGSRVAARQGVLA